MLDKQNVKYQVAGPVLFNAWAEKPNKHTGTVGC